MTCAHVVAGALGHDSDDPAWMGAACEEAALANEFTIDFPALQPRNGEPLKQTAKVAQWRPVVADVRDDIAVLALDGPAPAGATFISPAVDWHEDDAIRAFGITDLNPEGKIIGGRIMGRLNVNRWQIAADTQDSAILEGCSGAAVWNIARRGVVGMIVTRKLELSAEIIPIDLLSTLFPSHRANGPQPFNPDTLPARHLSAHPTLPAHLVPVAPDPKKPMLGEEFLGFWFDGLGNRFHVRPSSESGAFRVRQDAKKGSDYVRVDELGGRAVEDGISFNCWLPESAIFRGTLSPDQKCLFGNYHDAYGNRPVTLSR